jgi:transposase
LCSGVERDQKSRCTDTHSRTHSGVSYSRSYRGSAPAPRDALPERFGPWKSVYNRFSNWARQGHWVTIFRELQDEIDDTGSIVDGSIVRAHQGASGGKGGSNEMLWAVLEEVFQPSSTPSSTPQVARSTSRSRRGSATK